MTRQTKETIHQLMEEQTHVLGGNLSHNPGAVDRIVDCGDMETRCFHDNQHFLRIMQAWDHAYNAEPDDQTPDFKGVMGQFPKELQDSVKASMIRAAARHDMIYHHMDGKFPPGMDDMLAPYVEERDVDGKPALFIKDVLPDDAIAGAALTLFGFKPGDKLDPYNGQNEFLTAIIAGHEALADGVPKKNALAEMAIIEGTVPWGKADRFDVLAGRLQEAAKALGVSFSEAETDAYMYGAVEVANVDVGAFRSCAKEFLKGTWKLMKEGEAAAGDPELAKPGHLYDQAKKQYGFMSFLCGQSESGEKQVFHGYKNYPPVEMVRAWEEKTQRNITDIQLPVLDAITVANALVTGMSVQRMCERGDDVPNIDLYQALADYFHTHSSKVDEVQLHLSNITSHPIERVAAMLVQEIPHDEIHRLAGQIREHGADTFLNPEKVEAFLNQESLSRPQFLVAQQLHIPQANWQERMTARVGNSEWEVGG